MKFFTKITIFALFFTFCVVAQPTVGIAKNKIEKRAVAAKKAAEKAEREWNGAEDKEYIKQQKKEAKALKKAQKKGRKRHLQMQSEETRQRLKEHKKESEKNFAKGKE